MREPFVSFASPGRMHLALRTRAANDNVPPEAMSPPRHADGGASTRWPLINRLDLRAGNAGARAANEFAPRPARKLRAWL
ncbi:MAG: hypothetical protein U1F37_09115 [Alphaproteobacteria bacterium]